MPQFLTSQFQNTRCCAPAPPNALPPRKYSWKIIIYRVWFRSSDNLRVRIVSPQAVAQLKWRQISRPMFSNRMSSNQFASTSAEWRFPWSIRPLIVSIHVISDTPQNDQPIQHHGWNSVVFVQYQQNVDNSHYVGLMIAFPVWLKTH